MIVSVPITLEYRCKRCGKLHYSAYVAMIEKTDLDPLLELSKIFDGFPKRNFHDCLGKPVNERTWGLSELVGWSWNYEVK